jgi:hypothetical protein
MQKLIHFALALAGSWSLLATPAPAQTFSNSNLDTWVLRNNVEAPANWQTTDDFFSDLLGGPLPFSLGTITKTTDAQSGPFAAKLETVNNPLLMDNIPAFLILGTNVTFRNGMPGGTPFVGRPAQVQFHYKLTGAGARADSAQVLVWLTRRGSHGTEIVALAEQVLPPAASYTQLTMPLDYISASPSDSLHIFFSSGTSTTLTAGTALYVDNISLSGTATATQHAQLQAAVSVYPNPSAGGTFQLSSTKPELLAAAFTVTDATGRVVQRSEAARPATTRTVDLSRQPAGLYALQLHTAQGLVMRKLVVQ